MHAMRSVCALGAVLLLTACAGTPPTRLYVLSSVPGSGAPEQHTSAAPRLIAVGPVTIPAYADRPEIVTREGPNRLSAATFDQWAGSLSGMAGGVLVQDLASRLPRDRVVPFGAELPNPADARVTVSISQFDVSASGEAVLAAHWAISRAGRPAPISAGDVQGHLQAAGKSYDAHVAAMSRLMGILADRIAAALEALPSEAAHAPAAP